MHFKKSADIARNAHLFEFDIDDVTKLDEYLARRNVFCFTLFDAKTNTGLGSCAEPLLNEFVQVGILREPKARHLCPVHEIDLEIVNANEGKCFDCDATHLLDDCETEVVYERIATPETWSTGEVSTFQSPDHQREPPLWKDRRLHIALIPALIIAAVALFTHFHSVKYPSPPKLATPTLTTPTTIKQVEPSSTLTNFTTPTITEAATYPPAADITSLTS